MIIDVVTFYYTLKLKEIAQSDYSIANNKLPVGKAKFIKEENLGSKLNQKLTLKRGLVNKEQWVSYSARMSLKIDLKIILI